MVVGNSPSLWDLDKISWTSHPHLGKKPVTLFFTWVSTGYLHGYKGPLAFCMARIRRLYLVFHFLYSAIRKMPKAVFWFVFLLGIWETLIKTFFLHRLTLTGWSIHQSCETMVVIDGIWPNYLMVRSQITTSTLIPTHNWHWEHGKSKLISAGFWLIKEKLNQKC